MSTGKATGKVASEPGFQMSTSNVASGPLALEASKHQHIFGLLCFAAYDINVSLQSGFTSDSQMGTTTPGFRTFYMTIQKGQTSFFLWFESDQLPISDQYWSKQMLLY